MKKRILFVDDEPAVLELFGLMFKGMADQWDILVASNGAQALEMMAKQPVEVVVSDMRMPGMSGAQLLNATMERHPKTARIILSGYAEQEAVAQCVGAVHQYLMKPCSVNSLRSTLSRVCALDLYLQSEKLKALVSKMGVLPSLPSLYFRMLQELQSPNASLERIGELVAMDLGMTAKVLQLVNSAFFGSPRKVSNSTEAVQLLGVGTVRSLALYLHAFSCFDQAKLAEFSFERLWNHSVTTGVFAKRIAHSKSAEVAVVDETFIAGLLHDIGKLMMISNMPDDYRKALKQARADHVTVSEAERAVFGAAHSEVGAYLLGLWGLPASIVEAVALHHEPDRSPASQFSPLAAVHLANILEHELSGSAAGPATAELNEAYLKRAELFDEIEHWRSIFGEMTRQGLRT